MTPPTQRPLCLAVVGHTNAGKTSLLRALTRRVDFGEVSDRPGTTRHVESIALRLGGRVVVHFLDTPGLEDSVALDELLQAQPGDSRHDRLRAFLAGPEARSSFEQEAKVLRSLMEQADAGLLVIDTREPVLPKFRAEVDILSRCARPLMPVLNFVRDAASRAEQWQQMLREAGLHVQIRFDVVTPFHGSEQRLYRDLGVLLHAPWEAQLQDIARVLQQQAEERLQAGARLVASVLIDLAAMRRSVPALPENATPSAELPDSVRAFQRELRAHVQRAADELLDLYAFRPGEADLPDLPTLVGRWERDLFHPEQLQQLGARMGLGAALGAGLGLLADLAVGGLSLGSGAALGGSLGGGAGGLQALRGKLKNWVSGLQELSAPDALLLLVADRLCLLLRLLSRRSHAEQNRLQLLERGAVKELADAPSSWLSQLLRQLDKARAHPDWERGQSGWRDDEARQRLMQQLAQTLLPQLQAAPEVA